MKITLSINPKKIAAAALVVGMIVSVSACQTTTSQKQGAAVKAGGAAQYDSQALSVQAWEKMTANIADKYPASILTFSTELNNLNERLQRYNNPSKISYIYLLSQTGSVISYYTIKGKVSSNSSQMTADQDIIDGCPQSSGKDADGVCPTVVNAPQDDGSFGQNEPGIFFFTTDNVMITWGSENYLLSDAPLKINPATLTLTYTAGSKPTSTGGVLK